MSTTLELPDDVASALANRAERAGQKAQDAGIQILRQVLTGDSTPVKQSAKAKVRGRLEADPETGLPVIRCAADAPARTMTTEQLIALEHETLLEEDLERI
jgi:plasmid stability protein